MDATSCVHIITMSSVDVPGVISDAPFTIAHIRTTRSTLGQRHKRGSARGNAATSFAMGFGGAIGSGGSDDTGSLMNGSQKRNREAEMERAFSFPRPQGTLSYENPA